MTLAAISQNTPKQRPQRALLLLTTALLSAWPALAHAEKATLPLSAAPADDGQWVMPGKNFAASRFSSLDEINTKTVKNLQVAFAFSTGVNHGQEAAPIVANNTMYIVTPFPNIVYALDLTKLTIHQFRQVVQSLGSGLSLRKSFMAVRIPRVNHESFPRAIFFG